MSVRVGKPRRIAVMASVLLVAVSGCTEEGGSRGEPSAPPLERYLDLPIAKYSFTPQEIHLISLAERRIATACMRKYGFEYHAEISDSPASYQPGTNRRYGVLNPAVASRYGYHFPDVASSPDTQKLSERENLALNGRPGETTELNGQQVPEGGCLGQAKSELRGKYTYTKGAEVARTIATNSFTESMNSPTVLKATHAWAQCMKEKGFPYGTPLEALGATENSGQEVTKREISVALADIDCKGRTDLVKIWSTEEAKIQNSQIAENEYDLGLLSESHRKILSEARSTAG
ncbi:hypothetical protein IM697_00990 [Streptomyces ferrugineus]|uniref:Lipoprotein n=1 Tax=Streptomyces ferrugineus TaxID=1413221 RepID=A0A7M2SNL9_9ACTN|nr:hypothetical protein [Streptomyces ferrugineus]QOV37078.1 hypothetical protein IM697_00990 [Streptomyces ferrugineus]